MTPLEALPSALPEAEPRARLPRGYRVAGTSAGIKASGGPDLGLIVVEDGPAAVAATFTTNRLPAAPVLMDREHLMSTEPGGGGRFGWCHAMMATSGCANAATGSAGLDDQRRLASALAEAAGTDPAHVLAMSTGLIGTRLPVERIRETIRTTMGRGLGTDDEAYAAVAEALRTTDSRAKAATVELELPGPAGERLPVLVSGISKGVGMIHPQMATMLSFLLTDGSLEPATLHALLRPVVARTWDQISVDGDQSTNDTVLLVASGASGSARIEPGTDAAAAFSAALEAVSRSLARQQAGDGEGATTLLTCAVSGARDDADARAVARSVISSSLVKAAIHGADPNWGRVAGAVGNAVTASAEVLAAGGLTEAAARERAARPVHLEVDRLRIDLQGVPVFAGSPVEFDAPRLREALRADEVLIRIDLGMGSGTGEAFGCDLTEAYVTENSEYST